MKISIALHVETRGNVISRPTISGHIGGRLEGGGTMLWPGKIKESLDLCL